MVSLFTAIKITTNNWFVAGSAPACKHQCVGKGAGQGCQASGGSGVWVKVLLCSLCICSGYHFLLCFLSPSITTLIGTRGNPRVGLSPDSYTVMPDTLLQLSWVQLALCDSEFFALLIKIQVSGWHCRGLQRSCLLSLEPAGRD